MTDNKVIDQKRYQKLKKMIELILDEAKMQIKNSANNILADSYWRIGKKIANEGLTKNANYQNLTLQNLEDDLKIAGSTLSRALKFYETYPKGIKENLSWSNYRQLITIKDDKVRDNFTKEARVNGWTVKELEFNIRSLNDGGKGRDLKAGVKKSTAKKIKRPMDPSYLYKAKIIDVVDGDTLILQIDLGFDVLKKQRVRLTQIDAPEIKSAAGRASHRYLRDLCARIEEVVVKTNQVDIYGRFLADVFYLEGAKKRGTTQGDIFRDGIYLNQRLVDEGVVTVW